MYNNQEHPHHHHRHVYTFYASDVQDAGHHYVKEEPCRTYVSNVSIEEDPLATIPYQGRRQEDDDLYGSRRNSITTHLRDYF
jgi:hypothetical protein